MFIKIKTCVEHIFDKLFVSFHLSKIAFKFQEFQVNTSLYSFVL